jgi:hypothetical protein
MAKQFGVMVVEIKTNKPLRELASGLSRRFARAMARGFNDRELDEPRGVWATVAPHSTGGAA